MRAQRLLVGAGLGQQQAEWVDHAGLQQPGHAAALGLDRVERIVAGAGRFRMPVLMHRSLSSRRAPAARQAYQCLHQPHYSASERQYSISNNTESGPICAILRALLCTGHWRSTMEDLKAQFEAA